MSHDNIKERQGDISHIFFGMISHQVYLGFAEDGRDLLNEPVVELP